MFDWLPINSPWFLFGVGIIIVVPLLLIILNELSHKIAQHEVRLKPPFNLIKNLILPLVAVTIVLTRILDFSKDLTIVKLVETVIWVLTINAFLAIFNILVFSKSSRLVGSKVPQLFLDIFRVVMVLIGIAIVLSTVWGADLGKLVTALGLGSFVLGLALQDTLGNLFSGIALVYEKPFNVGQIIKVGDTIGRVKEMNWRAVRLETREKVTIVIPHLVIGQEKIENLSNNGDVVILKQNVGFSYENPPNQVKEAIMKTCLATKGILHDPLPEVKTIEYADFQIVYEIEFGIYDWMNNEEVLDDLMSRIWYTAKREELIIPFPQVQIARSKEDQRIPVSKTTSYNDFLEDLPKLLPISKEAIQKNKDQFLVKYFGKGEYLIREGDTTGSLFIVMEGEAIITSSKAKQNKVIQNVFRGDFVGEITLFTGKKSQFDVIAVADLIVLLINEEEASNLVKNEPTFASFLDSYMDKRRAQVKE